MAKVDRAQKGGHGAGVWNQSAPIAGLPIAKSDKADGSPKTTPSPKDLLRAAPP